MSKRLKKIEVEWDDSQDIIPEEELPNILIIPADIPDEDVIPRLIREYGYNVNSWKEV